jgi:hypothetical protein
MRPCGPIAGTSPDPRSVRPHGAFSPESFAPTTQGMCEEQPRTAQAGVADDRNGTYGPATVADDVLPWTAGGGDMARAHEVLVVIGAVARRSAVRLDRLAQHHAWWRQARYRVLGCRPDPEVDDHVLADRIRSELGPVRKQLDLPHVHVTVHRHVAILHGDVGWARDAATITRRVRDVSGVRDVDSRLHVGLLKGDTRPSESRRAQYRPRPRPQASAMGPKALRTTVPGAGFEPSRSLRCGGRSLPAAPPWGDDRLQIESGGDAGA